MTGSMALIFADTGTAEGKGTGKDQLFVFMTQGRLLGHCQVSSPPPPVPVFPEPGLQLSHHTQLSGLDMVLVEVRVEVSGDTYPPHLSRTPSSPAGLG